jgi:hypothetical protein
MGHPLIEVGGFHSEMSLNYLPTILNSSNNTIGEYPNTILPVMW